MGRGREEAQHLGHIHAQWLATILFLYSSTSIWLYQFALNFPFCALHCVGYSIGHGTGDVAADQYHHYKAWPAFPFVFNFHFLDQP
jgi:hypothetical protein